VKSESMRTIENAKVPIVMLLAKLPPAHSDTVTEAQSDTVTEAQVGPSMGVQNSTASREGGRHSASSAQ